MQWLGVGAAVLICAGLLLAAVPALAASPATGARRPRRRSLARAALAATWLPQQLETAYATYRVEAVDLPGYVAPRVFRINNSPASILDAGEPPRYARYIRACAACCSTSWAFAGAACWCWAPAASRCRTASRSITTPMSTSTPR
jgi:hypothetical protein